MTAPSCFGETWDTSEHDVHQNQFTTDMPLALPWLLFDLQDLRESLSSLLPGVR